MVERNVPHVLPLSLLRIHRHWWPRSGSALLRIVRTSIFLLRGSDKSTVAEDVSYSLALLSSLASFRPSLFLLLLQEAVRWKPLNVRGPRGLTANGKVS